MKKHLLFTIGINAKVCLPRENPSKFVLCSRLNKNVYLLFLFAIMSLHSYAQQNFIGFVTQTPNSFKHKMVSFNMPNAKSSVVDLDCPISNPNAVINGVTLSLLWGAWVEDRFIGYWKQTASVGEGENPACAYLWYKPQTNEWGKIGFGDLFNGLGRFPRNASTASYDPIDKVMYVGNSSVLLKVSVTDTNCSVVGSFKDAALNSVLAKGLANNAAGTLFMMGADYKLYKVHKETAELSLVGVTDQKPFSNGANSAFAFDYKTQKLYWQFDQSMDGDFQRQIAIVDTNTAGVSIQGYDNLYQMNSMASVYYTKNIPSQAISKPMLSYEAPNVRLKFTIPSLDANGNEITNLAKIYIVKRIAGTGDMFKRIDSLLSPVKGEAIEKVYLTEEGIFEYGAEVLTSEGISSGIRSGMVECLPAAVLPYANGFEDDETDAQNFITAIGAVLLKKDGKGYEGTQNAYALAFGNANKLRINRIPMKKGYTYKISVYAKSSGTSDRKLDCMVSGGKSIKAHTTTTVYQVFEWLYTSMNEQITYIDMNASSWADSVYVDNLRIEEFLPPTVPAGISNLETKPATDGKMAAIVRFTTPDKNMGGDALSSLDGIIIEYTTNKNIFPLPNFGRDTVKLHSMGKDTSVEIEIKRLPGRYHFLVRTYNAFGVSPVEMATQVYPQWYGFDTIPANPQNVQAVYQVDGKIKLSWDAVKQGANEGYNNGPFSYDILYSGGDIPSTSPIEIKDLTETSCIIDASLPLGVYQFEVASVFNKTQKCDYPTKTFCISKSTQDKTIVVGTDNMPYANVSDFYPFGPLGFDTYGTKGNSNLSQMLYSTTEVGGAMYIDTLFFLTQVSSADYPPNIKQYMRIYLGSHDSLNFATNTSYAHQNTLTKVFDDTVHFPQKSQIIAIPISGFYYEGTKPLLVQMVKPILATAHGYQASKYVYQKDIPGQYRTLYLQADDMYIDTMKNFRIYPATDRQMKVPSLVVGKDIHISKISGIVTAKNSGEILSGATISILSKAGKKPLDVNLHTNASGKYEFDCLPIGEYMLRVSATACVDTVFTLNVNEVSDISVDISLSKAGLIAISGYVVDLKDNPLDGVNVKVGTQTATSGATGLFCIPNVYGSTTLTLDFEKEGMLTQTLKMEAGNKDTILPKTVLHYIPMPVANVSAVLEGETAKISWTAPEKAPANGYRIYRGLIQESLESYTLLNTEPFTGTSYIDQSLQTLPYGVFKYAVRADYYGQDLSDAVYSDSLSKNMAFTVYVKVKTDGASAANAIVKLGNETRQYAGVADTKGELILHNVWRDTYTLSAELEHHKSVQMNEILVDGVKNIETKELSEYKANVKLEEVESFENTISLKWSISDTVYPSGFELYLNEEKKKTLVASLRQYTFDSLTEGEYVVGIKAVFASGATAMSTKSVYCDGLPAPINLTLAQSGNKLKLSWEAGGYAMPTSYTVFLDDQKVAENLQKTDYLFENLSPKTYLMSVVSVFTKGESKKTSISHTIVSNESVNALDQLLVYPNPTNQDFVKIYLPIEAKVGIYSADGKLCMDYEIHHIKGTHELSLSGYKKGTYFIRIIAAEGVRIRKLIIL